MARASQRAEPFPRRVGEWAGVTKRSQSHCREHMSQPWAGEENRKQVSWQGWERPGQVG